MLSIRAAFFLTINPGAGRLSRGRGSCGLDEDLKYRGLLPLNHPKESDVFPFLFLTQDALPDNHIYKAECEVHLYLQSKGRTLKERSLCIKLKEQSEQDCKVPSKVKNLYYQKEL